MDVLFLVHTGSIFWLVFFNSYNFSFHRRPILLRCTFIVSSVFALLPLARSTLLIQMLVSFDISQCFQCLVARVTLKAFFSYRYPAGRSCVVLKLPFESFSKCHCWTSSTSVRITRPISASKPVYLLIRSRTHAMHPRLCLSHLILVELLARLRMSQYPFSHH